MCTPKEVEENTKLEPSLQRLSQSHIQTGCSRPNLFQMVENGWKHSCISQTLIENDKKGANSQQSTVSLHLLSTLELPASTSSAISGGTSRGVGYFPDCRKWRSVKSGTEQSRKEGSSLKKYGLRFCVWGLLVRLQMLSSLKQSVRFSSCCRFAASRPIRGSCIQQHNTRTHTHTDSKK